METSIKRADSGDIDFRNLVSQLDHDLALRDGADHAFYSQFNKIGHIGHVVVLYEDHTPVACGAIKKFSEDTMEVKRMFVVPTRRGLGYAGSVLAELERWAQELSFSRTVLETPKRQPEAIALYMKHGYRRIPNYGQYQGVANSVCFEKLLN